MINFKKIERSFKTGMSFGLTSAVITTIGLMVGLYSGTNSKTVVLSGILIIAIADAFSDALGIHLAEESKKEHSHKEVWLATLFTFLSKFIFTLIFIIPILIFNLQTAIIVSIIWGIFLLSALSFAIAKDKGEPPLQIILEHLTIATLVIISTFYIGKWTTVMLD